MSPRLLWVGLVGLGMLTASCGSSREARPALSQQGANRTFKLAQELNETTRRCEALRSQVTIREEYALGSAVAVNWVRQGGGLMFAGEPEQRMHRTLNLIGQNLAAQSRRPTLEWTFGVLEDPHTVNAASAPGGYVFVTRALLQGVDNEAQLAGVLAHEIAHVTGKHALQRYGEVKVTLCKVAVTLKGGGKIGRQTGADLTPDSVDILVGAAEKGAGRSLDLDRNTDLLGTLTDKAVDSIVENGFGDKDEFAADEEAVRLMVSAGYDPEEYIRFIGKLPESKRGWANHPRKSERVKHLVALLKEAKQPAEDFPELPAGTTGLAKPTLPPEFSVVKSAVARDKP